MKKIFFISIFVLFVGIIPHALAATQGFTALAPIPGLTDVSPTAVVSSATLATFLNNLYKYLIGLAAIIAVIQIIWAGLDMAWEHKDSVAAITDDKGKIKNAIFGLVLVLSPALVFTIINPSILNLSLNLPAIKTGASTAGGAGSGTSSQTYTTTTVTCGGTIYSQTQKVPVPANQYCANVLPNDSYGNNWVNISSSCVASSTVINAACSGSSPSPQCQLCGLSMYKTPSSVTSCGTGGTPGILQIAWCPSDGDAKTWLNNNCGMGKQTVVGQKTDAYGNVSEEDVLCTGNQQAQFTFIETDQSLLKSQASELSPIASTPGNPNNGQQALEFMGECNNLGWDTCISNALVWGSTSIDCPTGIKTLLPSTAPTKTENGNKVAECYNEVLSCVEGADAGAGSICSANPSWSIFQ
jgi:hypothetical protein